MAKQTEFQLSERAESVLKDLICRYIFDGTPVGSRVLSKETDLSLSPASIRNIMSDLEECGLIESPHTSAGRIPTQKGYRIFINTLLDAVPVNPQSLGRLEHRLRSATDAKSLLQIASETLSQLTSFAGIVLEPSKKHAHIRQIEFLKLPNQRVLTILITTDGQVQNKTSDACREYSESELIAAANFFNAEYATKTLEAVRLELLKYMQSEHKDMHREMRTAFNIAGQMFDDSESQNEAVLISGENNLLSVPDFAELEKLKQLLDTLKTRQILFDLLQRGMEAQGMNVFIGEESGYQIFKHCSLICAPYEVDNERVGMLGVIGPTRMQYNEVISVVDVTAKLLGNSLSAGNAQF